jgi:hypothetical protein
MKGVSILHDSPTRAPRPAGISKAHDRQDSTILPLKPTHYEAVVTIVRSRGPVMDFASLWAVAVVIAIVSALVALRMGS